MYSPVITYRFLLDSGNGFSIVTPVYGSDLSKESNKPNKEEYSRDQMKGELVFMKADYERIVAAGFNQDFIVKLQRNTGSGYFDWLESIFNKTDCEFDGKNKKVKVSPEPNDKYRKLLGSMDKEYNLISLAPPKTTVRYVKQAIIQIYIAGSGFITNITRGSSWDQKVINPTGDHNTLVFTYFFGWGDLGVPGLSNGTQIYIPGESGGGLVPDVSGNYQWDDFVRSDSAYRYYNIGHHPVPADPTNRPEGEVDNYMDMPNGTSQMDDFDDVLSVWHDSLNNHFEFIGKITGGPWNTDRLYWRAITGGTTPAGTTMTHVSGGVYTTTFTFSSAAPMGAGAEMERGVIQDTTGSNYVYYTRSVWTQETSHDDLPSTEVFNSVSSSSTCNMVVAKFYTRLLCDLATLNGDATFDVPDVDIVDSVQNYTKIARLELPGNYIHDGHIATDGKFGRFSDDSALFSGNFFEQLLLTGNRTTFAIDRLSWKYASLWYWHTPFNLDALDQAEVTVNLKDAYHLHEVIIKLFNEIDPTITFLDDSNNSAFLYSGINPVSTDIQPRIFISPKSNVVVSGYDKPAERAMIKPVDVFNLLMNAYNLRWFIDSVNRLRIEHISWFENGGSYTGNVVGTDLTDLIEGKTKKPWSFGANKYRYEKNRIPERIKFGWMDEVSDQFTGKPIQMNSKYVQLGNIEDKGINRFTSDIDFIQGQPSVISHDGFVVFAATEDINNDYVVPFLDINLGPNKEWSIQNGYLAMIYLHDKYHRHGLPADNVNLNEEDIAASSVTRNKLQSLEYPAQIEPDALNLVKTDIGEGQVSNMSINISTNETKLNIRHDTE